MHTPAQPMGTVLRPMRIPDRGPATSAVLDARGAASTVLAAFLRAAEFRRQGGDGQEIIFSLQDVKFEWPEFSAAMLYPSASIVDIGSSEWWHSFVPTPMDATFNCFGPDTMLWKLGEFSETLQVDFWANDGPTRMAIAARLPSLFSPGENASNVILAGTPDYWCLPVRCSLMTTGRRMDTGEDVYNRVRRLMAQVRVDLDIVELRCATLAVPSAQIAEIGESVVPDSSDTTGPICGG